MGINFNFGLGGKSSNSDDGSAATTSTSTIVTTDLNAGSTPPPTEPVMVQPPNQTVSTVTPTPIFDFGEDITINVTDAPDVATITYEPTGQVQMTEAVDVTPLAPTPIAQAAEPVLNPFLAQAEVTPVMTENPFATPISAPPFVTPTEINQPTLQATQNLGSVAEATALNPFATDINQSPTVGVNPFFSGEILPTEAPTFETNQTLAPEAESNENPFASESPAPAATANPFATEAQTTDPVVPVAPISENNKNPFTGQENLAETTTDTEVNTNESTALNPFANAAPDPAEAENAVSAEPIPDSAAINPFAETPAATAEETNNNETTQTTEVSPNPFADMNIGEDKAEEVSETADELATVSFNFEDAANQTEAPESVVTPEAVATETNAQEEAKIETPTPVEQEMSPVDAKPLETSEVESEETQDHEIEVAKVVEPQAQNIEPTPVVIGDGSSPLSSLQNIKAEISGFVATHNQNVEDYKSQIKDLEGKIRAEKDLLKKRKQEFRAMLGEIEALTEDFTPHQNTEQNKSKTPEAANQNSKPKRKRNRNKNKSSENGNDQALDQAA